VGHDVNRRDFVCRYSDESRLHLWTTADAKDGDVLVCYSEVKGSPIEQAGIFKQYVGQHGGCSNTFLAHTGIDWDGNIIINGYMGSTDILPATKEQRDLLFKKMREAGYEWDAGKKELRKIIEPKFKTRDWIIRNDGSSYVPIQIYSLKKDRYLVTNMIGSKGEVMLTSQDKWHLWTIQDAKDGDVLATGNIICIFKKLDKDGYYIISPCIYTVKDGLEVIDNEDDTIGSCGFKPATKEDRELLFRKIQEAGYEWDVDKKELLKTIKPKFKVGDDIKTGNTIDTIAEIDYATHSYYCESGRTIWFENQDLWHLAPKPHYDIANFHEGMPVLVRDDNSDEWNYLLFSHYTKKFSDHFFAGGSTWCQCVPFSEDTKHLLGTTDPCDERYVNW
jgi:hypothetical protein